jgi:hypothetical protein
MSGTRNNALCRCCGEYPTTQRDPIAAQTEKKRQESNANSSDVTQAWRRGRKRRLGIALSRMNSQTQAMPPS